MEVLIMRNTFLAGYMNIANSLWMWLAAGLAVGLALFQSIKFGTMSYRSGLKMGLEKKQLSSAIRAAFITSIGPSVVILSGLLVLLVSVGGPMAWMRLSYIGSVMFEMMAVGFGAEAVGASADAMTETAFATAVWTMITGSIGWIIAGTIFADKMGTIQDKVVGSNKALIGIISTAAILGAFAALVVPHLLSVDANTVAALSGGGIMLVLSYLIEKKDIAWLKEWALAIALFGGMIIAMLF